jgi:hypothetical protein
MTYDDMNKNQVRAKRVIISELGGSTSAHIDVLPGDSFGQIAEKVCQSLGKTQPVTLFNLSGQPFPPNEEAYNRIEHQEELRYQVTGTGGSVM